jgi:uncharacterized protein
MSGRLPQIVHPGRLAESGAALRGSLPLNSMTRLAGYLNDTEGEVNVELEFGIDEHKVRYVQGRLRASLQLVCQRCLQPLAYPLEIDVALGLSPSEAAAGSLPGHYEPVVVEEPRLDLGKLVEDELLLALPIVPMHAPDACRFHRQLIDTPESGRTAQQETRRPFAGLGELLREKERN